MWSVGCLSPLISFVRKFFNQKINFRLGTKNEKTTLEGNQSLGYHYHQSSLDKPQPSIIHRLDIFLLKLSFLLPIKLLSRPKRYVTTGKSVVLLLHCVFCVAVCCCPSFASSPSGCATSLWMTTSSCRNVGSRIFIVRKNDRLDLAICRIPDLFVWTRISPPTDKKSRVFESFKHRSTYKQLPLLAVAVCDSTSS